jgi:hypothetical protein
MGATRCAYKVLFGRPKGKRRRCEDNIKIDVQEVGWVRIDLIDLAQDRDRWRTFVNAEMNVWAP